MAKFCGKCGARLVVHDDYYRKKNGEKIFKSSYRCSNYIRKTCNASNISQKNVEKAFIEYISNIEDFNAIDEIQIEENKKINNQNEKLINKLNKQYENLEKKEKEILNLYVDNKINFENYINLKNHIDKEKNIINIELDKIEIIEDKKEMAIKKDDIIKNLKENWSLLTNIEKRQFLENFVDKIIIVNELQNSRLGIAKVTDIRFHTD